MSEFSYQFKYPKSILEVCFLICLLSMFDALLTLHILNTGGVELNSYAQLLIDGGTFHFILLKFLLTSVSVFFLLIHFKYMMLNIIKVEYIIKSAALIYTILIVYELTIISLN